MTSYGCNNPRIDGETALFPVKITYDPVLRGMGFEMKGAATIWSEIGQPAGKRSVETDVFGCSISHRLYATVFIALYTCLGRERTQNDEGGHSIGRRVLHIISSNYSRSN